MDRPVIRLTHSLALALTLAAAVTAPMAARAQEQVPGSMAEVQMSFAPVVRKAAPAVVNIYATQVITQQSPFFDDPFFSQFFGDLAEPRQREKNSLGSGVSVGDGLIVSNFHVVQNATDIRVVLADRREYDGTLVLADEQADLAVIRVEGADDLPALSFADSDALQVGDLALAIGNPFGVGQTVSSGIISGLARTGSGGGLQGAGNYFIQTDAPINPGNSGGALVNMAGELVGINTQIVTRSGGSNGIGFAIPAALVERVVAQAAKGEASFTRPWAGIQVQTVEADIAEALGLDKPVGLLVQKTSPGSPFAEAGLKPGDVILAVDGAPVNAPGEMIFRLSLQELDAKTDITILRPDGEQTIAVTMRAAEEVSQATVGAEPVTITSPGPFQGLVMQELTPQIANRLGIPADIRGVMIVGIKDPRSARNFRPGDIVTEVNGATIQTMTDLLKAAGDDRRTWKLVMNRRGGRVYLTWRG